MRVPFALGLGLALAWGTVPARADPDALAKAKAKFEADIAKAEETLVAALEKGIAAAAKANNKAQAERYAYEKELFLKQRIVPTAFNATGYAKLRNIACDALALAFKPELKGLRDAKKDAAADALEKEWSELLRAARGYGLAFPEFEPKTLVYLENRAAGLVLETTQAKGTGDLALGARAPKKRAQQAWLVEREETGVVFRNAASGLVLAAPEVRPGAGTGLHLHKLDPAKDTPDKALFAFAEKGRDTAIATKGTPNYSARALAVSESKVKGVTKYELALDAPDAAPPAAHLWVVTEVK